ncbi:nucleoside recognition protein [Desulfothermus okinawensis JCM 13304]
MVKHFKEKLFSAVSKGFKPAIPTSIWIIKITIPISFLVFLIKAFNVLPQIAGLFEPLFKSVGVSGDGALVYITAGLINIYAAIATINTLSFSQREITILALMCLISHNLPVEGAVQKKTGSSFIKITIVRIITSFIGAYILNLLIPLNNSKQVMVSNSEIILQSNFFHELKNWAIGASYLTVKIIVLIILLMILQSLLEEFKISYYLTKILKYPLMILGVPKDAAFLWIVANTLGLAYGAGILIHNVDNKKIKKENADILNYHIAISHSLLEDTLLFVAIGASLFWITIPRLLLASLVTWSKKFLAHFCH